VVNITGLGHPDDGVNEDIRLSLTGGTDGQLAVSAMHGVSGLKGDNLGPAELVKVLPEFGWGVTEPDIVVVLQAVDGLNFASDVVFSRLVEEVFDSGVVWVTSKDLLGLLLLVRFVDVLDGDDGEVAVVARVPQDHAGPGFDTGRVNLGLVQVEVDGDGEKVAVGETVVFHDTIVILLIHETLERGEASVEDELEIAQLSLVQHHGGECFGLVGQLFSARGIASDEVLEDTAW
jgi:hypothetical protein